MRGMTNLPKSLHNIKKITIDAAFKCASEGVATALLKTSVACVPFVTLSSKVSTSISYHVSLFG